MGECAPMTSLRIGLISDTHGLLRPQALASLDGVHMILHAGDIGGPDIIRQLGQVAPVHAIRGNNDTAPWAKQFPETLRLEVGNVSIYMLHDAKALAIEPRQAGIRVVIAGHSHQPSIAQKDHILYVNPGSAGPRRFRLPVSVAYLDIESDEVMAQIYTLDI